jgi:hypothetical protein
MTHATRHTPTDSRLCYRLLGNGQTSASSDSNFVLGLGVIQYGFGMLRYETSDGN